LTLSENNDSFYFIKTQFFINKVKSPHKNYIYFDHSATTPVLPEVVKKITACFTDCFGNASEPHQPGFKAKQVLEGSRETLARSLGASPEEIIFTGSGTESDNLAIFGIAEAYREKGNHIITSAIEHPAILMPLEKLSGNGFKITYLPVDKYGAIDPGDVKDAVNSQTIMVSVMHANNIVGTLQPIREIGSFLQEKGIVFHTDAVQSFCKARTLVDFLNVDLLSVSGHKIYGPKGIGALYIRKGIKIMPQILGGGHEQGIRSSTENIPGIAGLAKAAELGQKRLAEKNNKVLEMKEYIKKNVLETIEDVRFNGHPSISVPGNCNFSFKYIEGEAIVLRLDQAGIGVSSGSACSSSSGKPSGTLVSMGLTDEEAQGSVRVTLGFENTMEEADYFLEVLPGIIADLRKISPEVSALNYAGP